MTTPLPPSAIEAEEWYPGTRRLMGNQDGPFLLVAFQDASATVPIKNGRPSAVTGGRRSFRRRAATPTSGGCAGSC
jgi:hypothetical protein